MCKTSKKGPYVWSNFYAYINWTLLFFPENCFRKHTKGNIFKYFIKFFAFIELLFLLNQRMLYFHRLLNHFNCF